MDVGVWLWVTDEPESLAKTSTTAAILRRVTLRGYQRKVNTIHETFLKGAMNIVRNASCSVTGVLITFPEIDLPAL